MRKRMRPRTPNSPRGTDLYEFRIQREKVKSVGSGKKRKVFPIARGEALVLSLIELGYICIQQTFSEKSYPLTLYGC